MNNSLWEQYFERQSAIYWENQKKQAEERFDLISAKIQHYYELMMSNLGNEYLYEFYKGQWESWENLKNPDLFR